MATLTSNVVSAALAMSIPLEGLALIASIFTIMLALILTWAFAHVWFSAYHRAYEPHEAVLVIQVTNFSSTAGNTLRIYPSAMLDAIGGVVQLAKENWFNLLLLFAAALVGLTWNYNAPFIASAVSRIYICEALPVIENIPMRLLNLARGLYNPIWPLVSLGYDLYLFYTTGWWRILAECTVTNTGDLENVLDHLGLAIAALADGLFVFLSGDIFSPGDPLVLSPFLTELGLAANAALDTLDCFCVWLDPIFLAAMSIPQITALHTAIDSAVNTGLGLAQVILTSILNATPPFWAVPADSGVSAILNAGDAAEQALIILFDMVTDLLNEISLLAASNPILTRQAFGLPVKMATNADDVETVVPPTLSELMHAAANTRASARYGSASILKSSNVRMATPLWQIPVGSNLSDYLGFPALLRLISIPWSHGITEIYASYVVIANLTLNIISNPVAIFSTPDGIAYFQIKGLFDHLRACADAWAHLTIIIDDNFPQAVSLILQTILTLYETIGEMIIGIVFSVIFPQYLPGGQSTANCSIPNTCSYANLPPGWTIFRYFVSYADWPGSALQRSLAFMDDEADALGILLGCNASTIDADNCTYDPFQCAIRTTVLIAVEAVNQTQKMILYLPDLVLFNHSLHTFQDLRISTLHDLFNTLVECLSSWHVFLSFLTLFY